MSIILPKDLEVYKNILQLIWKYGNREVLQAIGFEKHIDEKQEVRDESIEQIEAEQLAADIESLGPTYIKIGQMLCTQLSILPTRYKRAIERLQDDVEPVPFNELQEYIEHELGEPLLSVFEHFDTTPIGAGSLAQVHTATTKTGEKVAVKVQRPGAIENVKQDFEALEKAAETLDKLTDDHYSFSDVIEHSKQTLLLELDFRQEASNLTTIRSYVKNDPMICVPKPISSLCSERILTMTYTEGKKVTDLTPREIDELNGEELADKLFRSYMRQILVHGVFHADPHPGNVLIDKEGRVHLLDLGMVGHVSPKLREMLTQLVLAIAEGHGDHAADIAVRIGEPDREYDHLHFTQRVNALVMQQYQHSVDGIRIGSTLLDIASICAQDKVRLPPIMSTIGKSLLNLDQLARALHPTFNPSASVKKYATSILSKHFKRSFTRMRLFDSAIEVTRLLQDAPRHANKLLDMLSRNDRGFKIDAIDEERLISGFEKIANRITYGLIVAALYVTGAMIMNVENAGPRLLDVPFLSWLAFAAGIAGTGLVLLGMYVKGPK